MQAHSATSASRRNSSDRPKTAAAWGQGTALHGCVGDMIVQNLFDDRAAAPAERRGDVGQNRLDDMGIIGDAELVGDGQEQGIGLRDSFIPLQLLDEDVRGGGIASAEDRPRPLVEIAALVRFLAPAPEVGAIAIVDEREDAAADRNARLQLMASLLPCSAERSDLGGLLDVERLSRLVVLERRTLQVQSELRRPSCSRVGAGP